MRKPLTSLVVALLTASALGFATPAAAENITMVGTITKITMAADGQSATAELKDVKTGESVTIRITDELTLEKFKDQRIVEGDEIRTKYDNEGGKNESKSFKKTAGC